MLLLGRRDLLPAQIAVRLILVLAIASVASALALEPQVARAQATDAASTPVAAAAGGAGQQTIDAGQMLNNIAAIEAEREAREYESWKAQFNRRSFEWHLLSTRVIFVLVVAIVLFGLWLTWLQFTRDQGHEVRRFKRAVRQSAEQLDDRAGTDSTAAGQDRPPVATTLKIGAAGVEITSQVIGMLILAFSLGFFYLYIKDVYPMQSGREALPVAKPASAAL